MKMDSVRIGVDGYNLAMPNGTGVATYGFALTETLRSMGMRTEGVFGIPVGEREELREILFYEGLERGILEKPRAPAVRAVRRWIESFRRARAFEVGDGGQVERRFFQQRLPNFDRILSAASLFERADRYFQRTRRFYPLTVTDPPQVMHWTYPVPIRMTGTKNVYTLHDLVPLKLPYATLDRKRTYFRIIEQCVRDADHICTVSESSRNDIIAQFGIAPDRITNTYQSAPIPAALATAPTEDSDALGIFGLKYRGFFLYFGAIEPKKNVGRLIEAYLSTHSETPLVIVGARAWQSERDLALVSAAAGEAESAFGRHIAQRIVRLDYLPRTLLLRLVAGAKAVVFPSLYEGFGLPVLEALQLGTPVITSDTSSLPEVAGDAALLVDPYDTMAISRAILTLDRDAALCTRMSEGGRIQAARFSTERYQERLTAMYTGLLGTTI